MAPPTAPPLTSPASRTPPPCRSRSSRTRRTAAFAAARGHSLVLLNNDTIPTDAWLDQLCALAESDPAIGMVGPMSNVVSGPQLVPRSVPYADLAGLHRFATQWRAEHRGQWFLTERLVGFCLLLKRQV